VKPTESEEIVKNGLIEMIIKHMPQETLMTFLKLNSRGPIFGKDYPDPPPRYVIPWRTHADRKCFDQAEFEASGRADGRAVKVVVQDKVILKRNKHDGKDG
jgi:hypothetical protein